MASHISQKIPIYQSVHQPSTAFDFDIEKEHLARQMQGVSANAPKKVKIRPIRQQTQFTCVSASISMALNALGFNLTESDIDQIVKAKPMDGADWINIISCLQHFGCRSSLVVPSTINQLKQWTDQGKPVLICWNPENKPWSHASVVFDVQDDGKGNVKVFVADPNMPNPNETVRIVDANTFYSKWIEKDVLPIIRRSALFVDREIDSHGRQTMNGFR